MRPLIEGGEEWLNVPRLNGVIGALEKGRQL